MADDQSPTVAAKVTEAARVGSWKFFGALFMENKDGVQAVSLHRLLGLTTYVACMALWIIVPERTVPDAMIYTLWAMLGINGAAKVAGIVKGTGNAGAGE